MDKDVHLFKKFYDDLATSVPTAHITLSGVEQLELFINIMKSIAKDSDALMKIMQSIVLILRDCKDDTKLAAEVFTDSINMTMQSVEPTAKPLPKFIRPMLENIMTQLIKLKVEDYVNPNS